MTRITERRVHTRLPCLADVVIEGKGDPVSGVLRDISLGGARVTVKPSDYPEPPLTLSIEVDDASLQLPIEQVRRQAGENEDVLGFRFIDADRSVLEGLVNALRRD